MEKSKPLRDPRGFEKRLEERIKIVLNQSLEPILGPTNRVLDFLHSLTTYQEIYTQEQPHQFDKFLDLTVALPIDTIIYFAKYFLKAPKILGEDVRPMTDLPDEYFSRRR